MKKIIFIYFWCVLLGIQFVIVGVSWSIFHSFGELLTHDSSDWNVLFKFCIYIRTIEFEYLLTIIITLLSSSLLSLSERKKSGSFELIQIFNTDKMKKYQSTRSIFVCVSKKKYIKKNQDDTISKNIYLLVSYFITKIFFVPFYF